MILGFFLIFIDNTQSQEGVVQQSTMPLFLLSEFTVACSLSMAGESLLLRKVQWSWQNTHCFQSSMPTTAAIAVITHVWDETMPLNLAILSSLSVQVRRILDTQRIAI